MKRPLIQPRNANSYAAKPVTKRQRELLRPTDERVRRANLEFLGWLASGEAPSKPKT